MIDIKTILERCQKLQRENMDVNTKVAYVAQHKNMQPYVTFTVYFKNNGGSVKTSIFCDNAEKRLRLAEKLINDARKTNYHTNRID